MLTRFGPHSRPLPLGPRALPFGSHRLSCSITHYNIRVPLHGHYSIRVPLHGHYTIRVHYTATELSASLCHLGPALSLLARIGFHAPALSFAGLLRPPRAHARLSCSFWASRLPVLASSEPHALALTLVSLAGSCRHSLLTSRPRAFLRSLAPGLMLSHSPLRAPFPPGLAPLALTFAGPFQISRGRAFAGSLRFVFHAVAFASAGSLWVSRLPLLACFASGLASRPRSHLCPIAPDSTLSRSPLLARFGPHAFALAFACHRWLAVGFAIAVAGLLLTPSLSPLPSRISLTCSRSPCWLASDCAQSTASVCASCSPLLTRPRAHARPF